MTGARLLAASLVVAVGVRAQGAPDVRAPESLQAPGTVLYELLDLGEAGVRGGVVTDVYEVAEGGGAVRVEPGSVGSLRAGFPVAAGEGGTLTALGPRDRWGWLVVEAGAGDRVVLDEEEVGVGTTFLLLDPGSYTVRAGGETRRVAVRARGESRVRPAPGAGPGGADPVAPTTVAPTPVAPTTVAPASTRSAQPQPPARRETQGPAEETLALWEAGEGGETALGSPVDRWRPRALPAVETAAPDPGSPDGGRSARGVGDCPVDAPTRYRRAAESLLNTGEYADALDCLNRLLVGFPGDRAAEAARSRAVRAYEVVEALGVGERSRLEALRAALFAADTTGDVRATVAMAEEALTLAPGDPAVLRLLRGAVRYVEPGGGPVLAFVYVPSQNGAEPFAAARAAVGSPPRRGYYLKTTEVTNAQFAHFLNDLNPAFRPPYPYVYPSDPPGLTLYKPPGGVAAWRPELGSEDLPVVSATWHGANAYAQWAGGRLPTRMEWAWAQALGGGGVAEAHLGQGTAVRPAALGQPDALGLYDLVGNAAEWIGEPADADRRGRRLRAVAGGSFRTPRWDVLDRPFGEAQELDPDGHIGFRVLLPYP